MDPDNVIEKVRGFNRFYMSVMNLLGDHYLGSEDSVTEARSFFEIYEKEGCNAAHIAKVTNIDKSCLSRILISHEKSGYLQRTPSAEERRAYHLYLTEKGKERVEECIRRSNDNIKEVLRHLSEEEQVKIAQALNVVIRLLREGECRSRNSSISRQILK